jgi:hypothetical protein
MSSDRVDFFIVGAMKSGTSSLRSAIGRSQDVNIASNELHFFDNDNNFARGLDWYHAQFEPNAADVLRGEKSPSYGFSRQWAERIAAYNPGAKILWIFRDPAERAISNFYHAKKRQLDAPDLNHAIENQDALERQNAKNAYVFRSEYQKHLANFDCFPRDQMRVLIFEEMLERPADIAETFQFLGAEPPAKLGFPHANEGDADLKERFPISDATRAELDRVLRPTVEAVEDWLGRPIAKWRK